MSYSLYFHVPFCKRKCDYCHFYVIPDEERFKDLYMEALQKEWEQKRSLLTGKSLVSVYFGGGTPTLLGPQNISRILNWIQPADSVEVTIEANPEQLTLALLKDYRAAGINRLSIGVQSFEDPLLLILGREHSSLKAYESVETSSHAGFENISIDLMYDIPHQTKEQWENTLNRAFELPITHLSLYNLTIEPHTVFFKKRKALSPSLPPAETSLWMLERAILKTEEKGLRRYEISAFGYPSRHNMGYWTGRPFLGLGPSAYSYWEEARFRNLPNIHRYSKQLAEGLSPVDLHEKLSPSAQAKELFAIRLRLLEGVPESFYKTLPEETFKCVDKWMECGWMEKSEGVLRLTSQGLLFHDSVAEDCVE